MLLSNLEEQLEEYLSTFNVPEDYATQIAAMYEATMETAADTQRRRTSIENRLSRLQDLYLLGDIERARYVAERDELTAELAGLGESRDQSEAIAQAAMLLQNISEAWRQADNDQRHRMAHLLFESVILDDGQVKSLAVRPDFAPFFVLDWEKRQPESLNLRKRRGTGPRDKTGRTGSSASCRRA